MATVNLGSVVPKVKVGTVTTLQPEENATVTVTGSGKEAVFDFGIPQGLGADAQFWTGTVEEFETYENTIEEGTIVNLTDDTLEDGDLIGVATLNRIASVESDVDNLDAETTKKEDMLSTMEEIEANTTEDKYASALAVKEGFDEINNSLNTLIVNIGANYTGDVAPVVTIQPNNYAIFTIPLNVPQGYKPIIFSRIDVVGDVGNILSYRIDSSANIAYVAISNILDREVNISTVVDVICIKSQFVGY